MLGTLVTNVCLDRVTNSTAERVFQNPADAGKEFSRFLENGAKMSPPPFINIDRGTTDTKRFFHGDWTIWKGPIEGSGLKGKDLQDPKSLNIEILEANRLFVRFGSSSSETCKERVASTWDGTGFVRPDWSVFVTLSRNRLLVDRFFADPRIDSLVFGGAVVRDPEGQPRLPTLSKNGQVIMLNLRNDKLSDQHPSLVYFR